MVIVSPLRIGLFHFQIAFLWLINGGDPITTYVRPGMIQPKYKQPEIRYTIYLHFSGWPLVGNEGMKLYMVMMGIHSLIP